MQRALLCLLIFLSSLPQAVHAQSSFPNVQRIQKPSGVSAPGESFTPTTNGVPTDEAPQIAEWTRTAGPDESIVLTGNNLSRFRGNDEGRDTRFTVYGAGGVQKDALIQRIDDGKAVITLPTELNRWGMYLIWPGNDNGYGQPIAVNKTDLWWVGPDKAPRGSIASVFGRNLANQNGTSISHVYLKHSSGTGSWVEVVKVNPYRVDFRVPTSLPLGDYEVWVHNGHGGEFGWSGPGKLNINDAYQWGSRVFNVKDFGARGDGYNDDIAAITNAINAADRAPGSTVYFPAGVYMVSSHLSVQYNTRWRGDGIDRTVIKAASNFSSQSYGMVFGGGEGNFEMENMTFDGNNSIRGYLDKPIYFRGSSDVKINNVKFNFFNNDIFDLHRAQRVFINNCEVIGMVSFLGSGRHIFIDNCLFKQTNNSTTALYQWSGNCVSVTNSTCQDFDNSNPNSLAGWGTGRFFTGDGNWGANYNTYLANNTGKDLTVSPIAPDQNMGEIFMWEGTFTDYIGNVSSSTDTRTRLNSFGLGGNSDRYAVIIKGKGFGQSRRITAYNGNEITLEEPWNVIPDGSSVIGVGRYIDRIVVYNNYLDGKPRALTSNNHLAAAGIQPFSGTFNFVADNNTLHELRQGTSNWAMSGTYGKLEPNYFSMYVNNKYINCRNAIMNPTNVTQTDAIATFGAIYRKNFIQNPMINGMEVSMLNPNAPLIHTLIFEHNNLQQAKNGFEVAPMGPWNFINATQNQILYKNNFSGTGSGTGSVLVRGMALRGNTYSGYANKYQVLVTGNNIVEGPTRVVVLNAAPNGPNVTGELNIWNSGTQAMNWSISGGASWLQVSQTSGSINNEVERSGVTLTANPKGLASGIHKAVLYVTANGKIIAYTVQLEIGEGTNVPQVVGPEINLVAPGQNATYTVGQAVTLTPSVSGNNINKVEYFAGNTKIGESSTAPYTIQVNQLTVGQHQITAKALSGGSVVATSSAVAITINAQPNVAPTATITSPSNGTVFENGVTVQVTADARDTDGTISSVRFFRNSVQVSEDFSSPYTASLSGLAAGTHTLTAVAIDDKGAQATTATVTITVKAAPLPTPTPTPAPTPSCSGTGSITWEYLYNVPWGTPLEYERKYNMAPSGTRSLTSFVAPGGFADYYGSRARGYICPPVSGNYTFFLAADDIAELWLSNDDRMENARLIASVTGWTNPGQYNKFSSQQSVSIYLEAGRRYFVQAVHMDRDGYDHMSVGWRLPNGTFEAPIQGKNLIPYNGLNPGGLAVNSSTQLMSNELGKNPYATVAASFIDLAPNPIQSNGIVRFAVTETAQTVVELYDAQGALVSRLFNGVATKDQVYQVNLNGSRLANGMYYCRLVSAGKVLQKQVVIAH